MKQYNINRLCTDGEKVIESEVFDDLHYLVKNKHIILISKKHGQFAVRLEAIDDLYTEMDEIRSVWGDIKTRRYKRKEDAGK